MTTPSAVARVAEKPAFAWSKVIPVDSDLQRFRLALMAGHSVADARRISKAPPPLHYDGQAISEVKSA